MTTEILTYSIAPDGKSITCLGCKKTSYNLNDVEKHYCANCKVFHDDIVVPFRRWWLAYFQRKESGVVAEPNRPAVPKLSACCNAPFLGSVFPPAASTGLAATCSECGGPGHPKVTEAISETDAASFHMALKDRDEGRTVPLDVALTMEPKNIPGTTPCRRCGGTGKEP